MATGVLAVALPKFMVIKSKPNNDKGNAYFNKNSGSVLLGEDNVFSTLVKIEAERASVNYNYINLRFCYFNRYWQVKSNDNLIVAESDQPEEDATKPSCTLFEPVNVDTNGVFYLKHVQSGKRVLVDSSSTTMAFYVGAESSNKSYLTFVDWNTLVKLPPNVAFKGDNGKFLSLSSVYLDFTSEDPNHENSSFVVKLQPDGNVQIQHFVQVMLIPWSVTTSTYSWVSNLTASTWINFWPVKVKANSIALRTAYNNNFCRRLSADGKKDCLSAYATTITSDAIMEVQETVRDRKIYNVRY